MIKLIVVFLLATNYLGAGYLTPRDIAIINELWPDYAYASRRTGFPLVALPAVHYREAHLRLGYFSVKRNELIKNIGGPFMADFGPLNDHALFHQRIRDHEKYIHDFYGYRGPVQKISHNFRFAALTAAHHLKGKQRCPDLTDENCLGDTFWGYNGRASWHRDETGQRTHRASSYVWNDPKKGLRLTKRYRNRSGEMVAFVDTQPGVMTILREIQKLQREGKIPKWHQE